MYFYRMQTISIHAPREGSDDTTTGETYRVTSISIHAPREGSDPPRAALWLFTSNFYPRSP